MKWILTLLAIVAVVSAIDHDDIRKLMVGYFDGLNIKEDVYELLKCTDGAIGVSWDRALDEIKKVSDWKNKPSVMLAFSAFVEPALSSLAMVLTCSSGEIEQIGEKIRKIISNPEELAKKITDNLDIIGDALRDFNTSWNAADYIEAGKVSGALILWTFIN